MNMYQFKTFLLLILVNSFNFVKSQDLVFNDQPFQLDIRKAGEKSIRITLKPVNFPENFPLNPALLEKKYPKPEISLKAINGSVKRQVGNFLVEINPDPLTVEVTNNKNELIQKLIFHEDGTLDFNLDNQPVLGLGEGGPLPAQNVNWRELPVEFDRRGRFYKMRARWQTDAYGSRNPVPFLIGTSGWGLFIGTPWGQIDLTKKDEGRFIPLKPTKENLVKQSERNQREDISKGIPPMKNYVPGLIDLFVFDTHNPEAFMKDVSEISGEAVMPPKWALGYMQSHRTLEEDKQMLGIVDTFRSKKIPLDAVIYLGTGFTPKGWNTKQPSFDFNPEVFTRDPKEVLADFHKRNVKVILHIVPWDRDKLPDLHGTIPPKKGEIVDSTHIATYWKEHVNLVKAGVDGWWPDEGDWFDLFERLKRHQMYYQGPLSTEPNIRPWSLERNGYLGVAKWGGWIWSGDTQSSWKSLEAQIAVGINHSLSLSPFWGSDIGGFFPNPELTGELYTRWFQFGAFCASFRAHGQTWWTRLPWGWGLSEMGPKESNTPPLESELNNPNVEPIVKKYDELRYHLLSYNYSLTWEARSKGLPMMRALWLHYPDDQVARSTGDQYLWGREMLIAPVYKKGATERKVYLPEGDWYDWWTNKKESGERTITREVDLSVMPIYVKAGAIIPFDPPRQYTAQKTEEPLTLRVYRGSNGSFSLYEDDGISLDYLNGDYELTKISWNDIGKVLTIEPEHVQSKKKESKVRTFRVEIYPDKTIKNVNYYGKKVTISF